MTPPRPRASHALQTRLAAALALRLRGHSVDRLWRPTEDSLLIRVTQVAPERLLIHLDPALPFVALTDPLAAHAAETPDQTTVRLRQALEGARFVDVTVGRTRRAVTFRLTRGDGPRSLRKSSSPAATPTPWRYDADARRARAPAA
jgi:predicted ribosome quality control (RQC) complex YloA/Tae2 family protein